MARLFGSSAHQDYMPLDDSDTFHQDLSQNYIINENVEESETPFTRSLRERIKIPQINFAYFKKVVNISERKRRILDLVVCVVCLIAVAGISLGLGYHAVFVKKPVIVIDKSYRAFRIPNHEASLNYGAFQAAQKNNTPMSAVNTKSLEWLFHGRYGRSIKDENGLPEKKIAESDMGRLKRGTLDDIVIAREIQTFPAWRMQVVFVTDPGENIFTRERLLAIHDIEKRIISHEKYPDFCLKDVQYSGIISDPAVKAINGCAPLNSLLSYFFPSKDEKGNIYYDGLGENMDNIDSALKLAMTSNHFYYFVDDKVNASNKKSQLIRTEVLFGAPLKGFSGWRFSQSEREEQSARFKEFVVSYIDVLKHSSTRDMSVLYGGQEIFDYEVEMTFWNDVKLAIYAFVAIFVLMWILTGSMWLTIWGLVSIVLSAPLALFFYRVVFKIVGLGILNGAAAFVIIGIGVDDVFVFINIFRQANHIKDARARTLYTIKTAGKATFFTSFTTAAAFAANIASMIPAVHDFGLFMSLIVANCWITVMLVMPPVLFIWHISFSVCEAKITKLLFCCWPSNCCKGLTLPSDVAHFMSSSHGNTGPVTPFMEVPDDDSDVPLLTLDEEPMFHVDSQDDQLIHVDPDPLYLPEDEGVAMVQDGIAVKFQALLYHGMALPIIKARWVILVISLLLMGVSIGLMTQLKTSTQPPQFFREDTNLQKLLNLKSQFSAIDTVRCYDCSAIYNIGVQAAQSVTPANQWPVQPPTKETHPPAMGTPPPTVKTPPPTKATPPPTKTTPPPHKGGLPTTIPYTSRKPTTWKPERTSLAANRTTTDSWKPPTIMPEPYYPPKPTESRNQVPPSPKSLPENYDVCKNADCEHPQERPMLETGATVYVLLGVKDFHWSEGDVQHVVSEDTGTVEFDTEFSSAFNFSDPSILKHLGELCSVCKKIANNSELVRNGSAQCLPMDSMNYQLGHALLKLVGECKDLPQVSYIYGGKQPAHAMGGLTTDGTAVLWLGLAFESTTSKSQSYFEAYKEYLLWEEFLKKLKKDLAPDSPLHNMFQTSQFWPEVLMEVVAVNSAIYSVVLSMIICLVAVLLFTQHVVLLLVIFISIAEMVCLVVGIFYVLGWEIGGVEAVSLSILVGSSVDYCVHLVEGYILAADACPVKDVAGKARQWRTGAAFSHIGLSVISSALTTIIAAVPLTQTTIQPFAKFGQIIAINTSVCIVYSLTVCMALLCTIAPAYFKPSWRSILKSVIGTCVVIGLAILVMFIMTKAGLDIPGPNGGSLFSQ